MTRKQFEALRALANFPLNTLGITAQQVGEELGIGAKSAGLRLSQLARMRPALVRCQQACKKLRLPSLYWITDDGRRVMELEDGSE